MSFFVEESVTPAALGRIEFGIQYAYPSVAFAGHGKNVKCTKQPPEATAGFDDDDRGRVDAEFESETGIPSFFRLLAVCRSRSETVPSSADITVVDLVEEDVQGRPVSIPVQILLPTLEDCLPAATTTSSTSTTGSSTSTSTLSTSTTTVPAATCGDPTSDGQVTATDSLLILNVAVGLATSPPCLCDVNGDGSVTATDALVALNVAVGQALPLACPAC